MAQLRRAQSRPAGRLRDPGGDRDRRPQEVIDAYEAPWPNAESKAGVAQFPLLVPTRATERPGRGRDERRARTRCRGWEKPALVCFSDSDPIFTPKAGQRFVDLIPGAGELRVIEGGAHFLQEDKGEQIAAEINAFLEPYPGKPWLIERSSTCWSAAASPRATVPATCASRAPRGRSCWSGASPTRPTTGRRSRSSTCAARSRGTTSCSGRTSWYEEQQVELLTRTSVMSLDPDARVATLSEQAGGRRSRRRCSRRARTCASCTSTARELDGIHYLRTMRNSDALRDELEQAERVASIGGSYIGTELAASFTALGKQCELIMLEAVTHERFYGPEVGGYFQDVLDRPRRHGARLAGARALRGRGRARAEVVTKSGLEVDVRLRRDRRRRASRAASGRAGRASRSDSGVLTDRYLETSAPGMFAAGDIAEYDSVVHGRPAPDRALGRRVQPGQVRRAQHARQAAGHTTSCRTSGPTSRIGRAWSTSARRSEWDEVWWRGSGDDGKFTAWYVKDGRLAAALTVGRSDDLAVAGMLLKEGIDLSNKRGLVEDADGDLATIVPQLPEE